MLTSICSSPQAGRAHDGADALGPGDPDDNLRNQVEPVRAKGERVIIHCARNQTSPPGRTGGCRGITGVTSYSVPDTPMVTW